MFELNKYDLIFGDKDLFDNLIFTKTFYFGFCIDDSKDRKFNRIVNCS